MNLVKNSIKLPLALLLVLFVFSTWIMWPGVMSPDGMQQYASALAARYSDHHPPMMSFVWRYLNFIHSGPGLMLGLHLLLVYVASGIFVYIFQSSKFKWWFAIYPIIPWVLAYTPLIVKDVGFAFAFLLAGAILAYLMIGKVQKHKWLLLNIVLLLLFYGCAVKYQAKFILLFFTLGAGYCIFNYKPSWKPLVCGTTLYVVLLQLLMTFNNYLVPYPQKSNSWEFVKLYDLAAISLHANKPLFPQYVIDSPNFSFAAMKQNFVPSEVDLLVFNSNPILRQGRNDQDRRELVAYWQKTLRQYPWTYLKARFVVWKYNITGTPSYRTNPAKFLKTIPAFKAILSKPAVYEAVGSTYNNLKVFLQFTWLMPFLLAYFYIGITKFKSSTYAPPLLMFSAASIALLLILFFMSMAGTARYVFVCICLVHASHGLAYCSLTRGKRKSF